MQGAITACARPTLLQCYSEFSFNDGSSARAIN